MQNDGDMWQYFLGQAIDRSSKDYLTINPWGEAEWNHWWNITNEILPTSWTEKEIIKLAHASGRNIYLGINRKKAARISLFDDYY